MNESANVMRLPVLEARGLEFRYPGGFHLGPIDLRLHAGDLVMLTGEPGAGKSTLLQLLAARLVATGGVLLHRQEPLRFDSAGRVSAWRRRLGILDQRVGLPPERSPRQLMLLVLAARGVWGIARRRECVRILGETGLLTLADHPCGTLSTGQSRWVQLALALCGVPELLLLDEPFAHLSPQHQTELQDFLDRLARRGTAVLYCRHGEPREEPSGIRRLRLEAGRLVESGAGGWR